MNIGKNIYELRKSRKITQGQLAEKLGVSEQAVSKWENNICAPDVSLFPIIAEFFGVSIDRLYGFHLNSYANEVKQIIKKADDSHDTYKEIAIISEGLMRYPNSPELKIYLAFSLSMVNRISENEDERHAAIEKAIRLCREVVDTCGDTKQVDSALDMLTRIYTETGEYQKAEESLSKISADRYSSRIVGIVSMLGTKKNYVEQAQYAEKNLWQLYWTMSHVFESMTHSLVQTNEHEKAIAFFEAHQKLLSVFDYGCPDFCATDKIFACEFKARTHMKMGDKKKCLAELYRFFDLATQVKNVAKSNSFKISDRNPIYFSTVTTEEEEYMMDVMPEKALPKYDGFFDGDERYLKFKEEVLGN